jgi:flagellar assembly factor FliW
VSTTQTPVMVESSRFGSIEIAPEAVIEFPAGLIGLGGSRYALLADEEEATFLWLHSLDDGELALPVTNPFLFFGSYEVVLGDAEAERIGITDPTDADVYVTVRAAEKLEDFMVNLRAPILVSRGRGFQVINEADEAPVRAPLFAEVTADWAA